MKAKNRWHKIALKHLVFYFYYNFVVASSHFTKIYNEANDFIYYIRDEYDR